MNLSAPVEIKVVNRRADGRGGVVEVPIIAETPMVNLARTAGGGNTEAAITVSDLGEMAANFAKYPGPVGIGAGSHARDRGAASPGFVESLTLRGDTLWARLDLGPQLFREVVDERAWRAFSIEALKNLDKPTVSFDGWVLVGGIFTNNPALDVHFKLPETIAASMGEAAGKGIISVAVATDKDLGRGQEQDMDNDAVISLASHEAKVDEIKAAATQERANLVERAEMASGQVKTLSEANTGLRKKTDELDTALATVTIERDALKATQKETVSSKDATIASLRSELGRKTMRLTEMEMTSRENEDKALSADVRTLVLEAINAGVPPAEFDDYEADPATWLRQNFAGIEAFSAHCTRRKATAKLSGSTDPVGSGSDPNADGADKRKTVQLTDAEQKVAERLGLNDGPDYTGCDNAEEAAKRLKEWKAKQA